jgi:hypothetical protein
MYVFQDGVLTTGTWKKADRKQPFTFVKDDGTPLKLNAGQTWFTAVSGTTAVAYK